MGYKYIPIGPYKDLTKEDYAEVTLKKYFDQFYCGIFQISIFSIFQKNQYLVNGESNQKIVTSKKDAELNSGPNPPH